METTTYRGDKVPQVFVKESPVRMCMCISLTLYVSQEYVFSNKDMILSQMHRETTSATEDVIIQGVSQDAQAGEKAVITYVHGKDDTASAEEV